MKTYLLAGKAGSGKNEAAKYIKKIYEENGKKACITEVSKYLKTFAKEILEWDGTPENKPRTFLQESGYTIRHDIFDGEFLINRTLEDALVYERYVDALIISDIRLPKEVEIFKEKLNAVSIKVINEFSNNNLTDEEKKHETEVALDNYDKFDYIIVNDSIDNLKNEIKKKEEKEG